MKMFFCKCALWVVDRLLGAIKDDQSDLTDLPDQADLKNGKNGKNGMYAAEELKGARGVSVEEWAAGVLAEHVPAVDVEVTLYGGPADGRVEKIPAGKPWPEMMLVKVGIEVHAYEQISGRAVFRYVRKVGVQGKR